MLVRVTVEVLLRTGLRVSEYTALPADAVVQIGAAPWLHVPVGKLHDDRYLPLHPQLVVLPVPGGPTNSTLPASSRRRSEASSRMSFSSMPRWGTEVEIGQRVR